MDDVVIPEARLDVRLIGRIAGRYSLGRAGHYRGNHVKVFACRSQSISPQTIVISGPLRGQPGENVTAFFDHLGLIKGQVTRTVESGFAFDVSATDKERTQLAARIGWLKARSQSAVPDNRRHARMIPRQSKSTLIMGQGTMMECFVIDMSASGAAISADILLPEGTPVAIGTVVARVVRQLEAGFAVRFEQEQSLETLEQRLIRPLPAAAVAS